MAKWQKVIVSGSSAILTHVTASGGFNSPGTASFGDITGTVSTATQAKIDHDSLANFVANEHIDHSGVEITAGTGLTGGGTIAATRTLNVIGGDGITANANDIAITPAQTTITSIYATDLKIGEDAQTAIDFETADEIHLDAANAQVVNVRAGGIEVTGDVTASAGIHAAAVISGSGFVTPLGTVTAFSGAFSSVSASGTTFATIGTATQGVIDHDSLANFVANEHIDHSGVSVIAGAGLTGGGTIAANRTLNVIGTSGAIEVSADAVTLPGAITVPNSITNESLVVGRDADNQFKFADDNQITVRVGASDKHFFRLSGFTTTDVSASGEISASSFVTPNSPRIGAGAAAAGTGSFGHVTGSFKGDGSGLTGVIATTNIDGLSAGTALHQTEDHFIYSDNGTEKKITFSDVEDAIFGNVSGDATIAAGGALTIGDSTVEEGMIVNDAVTADKLASNAVVNASIAANAAIAHSKLAALASTKVLVGNGSNVATEVVLSGDVTMNNAGAVTLANDAVVTAKITDANVTLAKIANAAGNTVIVRDAATAGVLSAKAVATTEILIGDGTGFTAASLSGDVTMDNTGAVTLGTVGANHITEISNLTAAEGEQLEAIGTTTISATQWGYVGALDQAVQTDSDVQFNNLTVDGNLVVAGTASFENVENLNVKDRFISLASGSTAGGDGGIVVNQALGDTPSGSAFGYEAGTANRWAVQANFVPTGSAMVPDAYMGIVTFSTAAPSGNPQYGGANYGYGNIHVDTDDNEIYIFA
jgi:hypothetical protein